MENRAVQTELEEGIKDAVCTQCRADIERELMRALDTNYLLCIEKGKHNRLCQRT